MKTHYRNKSQCKEEKADRSLSRNTRTEHNRSIDAKYQKKKCSNQKKVKKNIATSPDCHDKNFLSVDNQCHENLQKKVLNQKNMYNYYTLSNKKQNKENICRHSKNISLMNYSNIQESIFDDEFDSNINTPKIYSKIEKINKKLEENYESLNKGKEQFKLNNFKESIIFFKDSLQQNENLLEAQYLLAVSYLSLGMHQDSIENFQQLMKKCPNFKRNMYLLCAIAYKKIDDINNAVSILQKATNVFPKYYDAHIYRGKLQAKLKKFEFALKDFNAAIKLNGSRGYGYIGKADCLRYTNKYEEAIELYTEAMCKERTITYIAIIKRAITQMECKQYGNAFQDLQIILQNDPVNSEAYYFKGLLAYKQKNINEAILCFEQAIKHNNSKKAVTKSLYEIAKIKIELRDFYQAFYTLCRADYLDVDHKVLQKLRVFTDGVTFLMKRKFQEGIDNLTSLINKVQIGDFLKSLVYTYRAYGYFCLGKHQKALNDYQYVEGFQKLEKASVYNKLLISGIFACQKNQYEQAINFFQESSNLYPNKMEPYFYKSMTLIKFSNKVIPKDNQSKIKQYYKTALKDLEKACELNPNNANLCYHLGLLKFALQKTLESIQDIDKAMEKSEDNVAKYFYCRGLIYSELKLHKKALEDFAITISIDENYSDAYLSRAQSFFMNGDRNSAFTDLQKYTQLNPKNPDIHLWAGNLLFNVGAVDDAVKAYSHLENINQNASFLLLRCKCYMVLKELNSALSDMQKMIEILNSKQIIFDRDCLNCLKQASMGSQAVTKEHRLASFQESNRQFLLLEKSEKEGIFFKFSDLQFYIGVNYFYLENYEKALIHFNQSLELKKTVEKQNELKKQKELEYLKLVAQDEEVRLSDDNSGLEVYDFENRTYNILEFQLNIAICFIMLRKFQEAFQHLSIIYEIIPDDETRTSLEALIKILTHEIEAEKQHVYPDPERLNDEEIQILVIFPTQNRLCSIFPEFQLPFKIYQKIAMRLSFCLPNIKFPSMEPKFDQKLIESLNPLVVENKPEAPWIRRTEDGIVFTDNVQYFEELDLKTETKRSNQQDSDNINNKEVYEQNNQQNQNFNYDDLMFDNSYQMNLYNDPNYPYLDEDREDERIQPSQAKKDALKQHLQLDTHIQEKLNKILKNKNK